MAWLYVPGLAVSNWPAPLQYQDTELSVQLRETPLRQRSWLRASKTHPWLLSLSGMTSPRSTVLSGVESFISLLREFPASHGQLRGSSAEPKIIDGYGTTHGGLSGKSNRNSSSLKMSLGLFAVDFNASLMTLPKTGGLVNGCIYERQRWEPLIDEKGGFAWPTALAEDSECCGNHLGAQDSLNGATKDMMAYWDTWPSPTAVNRVRDEETLEKCRAIRHARAGQNTVPLYLEEVATLWKTPHGMGNLDARGKHGGSGGAEFAKQATQWPTPDACAMNDGESAESWRKRQERLKVTANNGNGAGVPLAIAAQELWTTPQAHDSGGGNPDRVRRKGTEHGCADLADDVTKCPTPDASMASGGRQSVEPLATIRPNGKKKAITLNDAAQSGIWDE